MEIDDGRIPALVSTAELERRWAELRRAMTDEGVGALVVQNSNDWLGGYIRWLTGLPAHNAYPRSAIFYRDRPMTIVEQGSFDSVRRGPFSDSAMRGVEKWFGTPSYSTAYFTSTYDAELIVRDLKESGVERIAIVNPAGMYYPFCAHLVESFGKSRVVDLTDRVDHLKAVKSQEELAGVRQAAALQDQVIKEVRNFAKPGLKDFELTAFAQHCAQRLGSEQGIFLGSSAPPGKASLFRGRSSQGRQIQKDDVFTLLVEVNGPGGYYTEIARTFVFGKVPTQLAETVEAMVAAQGNTLRHLVPGARAKDVFHAHNAYMQAQGLPAESRLHSHGQGYDMVERPLIRFDEHMSLAEGMNIVVHPGIVTEELFVTVCDNFILGSGGALERVHATPQTVIEL